VTDAPAPYLFVSYSHLDREEVRGVVAVLEEHGLEVYWDRELRPGERYDSVLARQIRGASAVLVAWSEHSVASDYVLGEAREARDQGKYVPILLRPCDLPFDLRSVHHVDWADPAGRADLFEVLAARLVPRRRHRHDVYLAA